MMQTALRGRLSQGDELHFHFALAKALEDRGDYESSFRHYEAGNRVRSQSLTTEQMAVTGFVDTCVRVFTAPFFAKRRGAGHPGGRSHIRCGD